MKRDDTVVEKKQMIPCLQLIRFIAAIGVMLSHIGFGDSYATDISFSAGVNLFFCISSFLMLYTTQKGCPENFVSKRLIRLLPLYWTLTIATFAASKILSGINVFDDIRFVELIKSLLCIPYSRGGLKTTMVIRPIVGPAWTMGYDVWFIFIFFVAMKISHKYRGLICAAMCLGVVVVGDLLPEGPIAHFMGRLYWINYISGVIVFYIYKMLEDKVFMKSKSRFLLCVISFIGLTFLYIGRKTIEWNILLAFITVITVLIGLANVKMPSFIMNFGKISYSFYLTHYFVILVIGFVTDFDKLNAVTVIGTVIAFAVSLLTGYIGYFVFEEKLGMKLKNLFWGRRNLL